MAWAGPNIRETRKCVRYYIRLRALLYLGCVRYCTWAAYTTILRLRVLLYLVACAFILGCARNSTMRALI